MILNSIHLLFCHMTSTLLCSCACDSCIQSHDYNIIVLNNVCVYAGTIIGQTYGIAKKATAIAIRVFGASGKGSTTYDV